MGDATLVILLVVEWSGAVDRRISPHQDFVYAFAIDVADRMREIICSIIQDRFLAIINIVCSYAVHCAFHAPAKRVIVPPVDRW